MFGELGIWLKNVEAIELELIVSRLLGVPMPFSNQVKLGFCGKLLFYAYCAIVILLVLCCYITLEIIDAIHVTGNLYKSTQNYCLTITHLAGLIKILNLIWRRHDFMEILKLIRHMNQRFIINADQKTIQQTTERNIKLVFAMFGCLVLATIVLSIICLSIYPNFTGEQFPYRAYIPEFIPKIYSNQMYITGVAWNALLIVVHDCFIMALMNQICLQLIILETSIRSITSSSDPDGQTNEQQYEKLKLCVKHHQLIIQLRNEVESMFTTVLLIQFFASLFIFGLTGFQATVTKNESQYILYAYCLCIFSELFIYCWFANNMIEQSKDLGNCGYYTSWYDFEKKFKKILIFLVMKSQNPLQLTAGGFFVLSLDTFTSILTRSYSYVALLRQIYYGADEK